MEDIFLHLAIDPEGTVDQPALTEALRDLKYVEYFNGNYVIQTAMAPDDLWKRLEGALGDTQCFIFAVHKDQFEDAYVWDEAPKWLTEVDDAA